MKLLEPIKIGGMELKNRVMMAPMLVNMGLRGRRARAFYVERAKAGVAVITTVGTSVDLMISDEAWGQKGGAAAYVQGIKPLTEAVHQAGARMGMQLFHSNRFPSGTGFMDERFEPVAPSACDDIQYRGATSGTEPKYPCRELTTAEAETIIRRFGEAAVAAREAGFDFVEFMAAHGLLAAQFFSPVFNRRQDRFGGDRARRMTFGLECIRAMRLATGGDFPIVLRIGAYDDKPEGPSLADNLAYAVELEKAGVSAFHVTVGAPDHPRRYWAGHNVPMYSRPKAVFADWASAFKQKARVPVIAVGRIHTPELAEEIVSQGKADLVAMARQLLADPLWVEKVASGRPEDIVPCLSCNTCLASLESGDIRCTVNPALGKEAEYGIAPAAKPKRVFVVGGGPAGMEAARIAALRGHDVTLMEKQDSLGGQLKLATVPPYKEEIGKLSVSLARLVEKAGVKVRLGEEASPDAVLKAKPDVLILAAGAVPLIPRDMPGVTGDNVVSALDVLSGRRQAGSRVVVVGGGLIGCETAEFLAQRGKRVTIVEMLDQLGSDLHRIVRQPILDRLGKAGVLTETRTRVEEITETGVKADQGGIKRWFEADTVVLAVGMTPDKGLVAKLEGKVPELHVIGDCLEPRKIVDAMSDGARVGRAV